MFSVPFKAHVCFLFLFLDPLDAFIYTLSLSKSYSLSLFLVLDPLQRLHGAVVVGIVRSGERESNDPHSCFTGYTLASVGWGLIFPNNSLSLYHLSTFSPKLDPLGLLHNKAAVDDSSPILPAILVSFFFFFSCCRGRMVGEHSNTKGYCKMIDIVEKLENKFFLHLSLK